MNKKLEISIHFILKLSIHENNSLPLSTNFPILKHRVPIIVLRDLQIPSFQNYFSKEK